MGKCVIFSAPSGSGKTTLVKHLLQKDLDLQFSISACTRSKRPNEIDGKDYYFLTVDEFKSKIGNDQFIEWEEVYEDNFYGTLKSEIERIWAANKSVIFDVDVIGGLNLKRYFGEQAIAIFVMPPDLATLEKRLKERGTEDQAKLKKRLDKAENELNTATQFDSIVLNDQLEEAKENSFRIVKQFLDQ